MLQEVDSLRFLRERTFLATEAEQMVSVLFHYSFAFFFFNSEVALASSLCYHLPLQASYATAASKWDVSVSETISLEVSITRECCAAMLLRVQNDFREGAFHPVSLNWMGIWHPWEEASFDLGEVCCIKWKCNHGIDIKEKPKLATL